MRRIRFRPIALALLLTLPAALPLAAQDEDKKEKKEEKKDEKKIKKDRERISLEELQQDNYKDKDLLTVIRALRPHFLQAPRGSSSMRSVGADVEQNAVRLRVEAPTAQVLVDGQKTGGFDVLKTMYAHEVEEIKYLNPNQAGNEYGLGYEGGVILIKRLRNKSP